MERRSNYIVPTDRFHKEQIQLSEMVSEYKDYDLRPTMEATPNRYERRRNEGPEMKWMANVEKNKASQRKMEEVI